MAVPTFVAAGTIVADISGGASTTPTPPTHTTNDILLAMSFNAAGATMSTATAGWTKITEVLGTIAVAWFWKRAPAAGTAGPTITAGSTDQYAICYVIRGCATTGTPFEGAATSGDGTTSINLPNTAAITTTGADELVMAFLGRNTITNWTDATPPSGWTANDNQITSSGTGCLLRVISIPETSPTSLGTQSFATSIAGSQQYGALTLAWLSPATPSTGLLPFCIAPQPTR